jgi:hypothetical protein
MGKYSDALLSGGAQAPAAPMQPKPAPAASGKYSSRILGEQSLTAAPPEIEKQLAKTRFEAMAKERLVDDPRQAAGVGATLEASLSPDAGEQIKVFARHRGIEEGRYGVDDEGNIGFINDQGQWVREVPTVGKASGPIDFLTRLGGQIGFQARPTTAQATGAVAGMATTAAGHPYLAIPAAGAAAAAVDVGAQALGETIRGASPLDALKGVDYANAAGQGTIAAGSQGVTTAIDRFLYRNPLRVAGYEIDKMRTPEAQAKYADTEALMRRQGISATPGEMTGSRSLLANQRRYGRMDETADDLARFYENRAQKEVPEAFGRMTEKVSPQASAAQGARDFQTGAQATIKSAKETRKAVGGPLYEAAKPDNINVSAVEKLVDKADEIVGRYDMRTANGRALQRIRNLFFATDDTGKIALDDAGQPFYKVNVGDLHKIRREIDTQISTAERAGNNELAGTLNELRTAFNDQMKGATPALRAADATWAQYSKPVKALEEGPVGLAAAERPTNFQAVPKILLSPGSSDPITVRNARAAFIMSGQEEAWKEGVRAYLDDAFGAIKKKDNYFGELYRTLFQDQRQTAILREALPGEQFQAFQEFMKALDIARRALPEGSPTATDLGKKAVPGGYKLAGRVFKGLSPQNIGQNVGEFIEEVGSGRNARKIVDIITKPGALQEIQRLKQLTNNQRGFVTALDALIVNLGERQVAPNEEVRVPAAFSGAR